MISWKLAARDIALVMAGGALGSSLRYGISMITGYQTSSPFPYKTLLINIIGCFLVGLLSMLFSQHPSQHMIRVFFVVGFLGAFTTFSAFSYETVLLYQDGHIRTAAMNILASTLTGVLAVLAGMWTGLKI
ncbi:MAG TPA: fluoride efflux transporter CrcB, partial [Candidatus Cloacimonadota bacterium]|nr:fluoride efflux transporter CrcB [Candidatus Cloacimonadota bacterium]